MRTLATALVTGALALLVAGCGSHGPTGDGGPMVVELSPEDEFDYAPELPLQDLAAVAECTLQRRPYADTFINAQWPDKNYGDKTILQCGNYPSGYKMRTLLRFSMKAIPPDSTIERAVLRLWPVEVWGGPVPCRIHLKTSSWDENTATWSNSRSGYDSTASCFLRVTRPMEKSWVKFDITTIVQFWEFDRGRNYGCMVRGYEGDSLRAVWWASREFGTRYRRPKLVVHYNPPS
jgi:hypothetical protein